MSKTISKTLRYKILERDGFKCRACGATNCLEIDHIVPRSKGGATMERNLQVLCADCNRGKGSSMPDAIDPLTTNYELFLAEPVEANAPNGITFNEWRAKHDLARSTAYTMLKIANITPEVFRSKHSRSPVSYLTFEHQQELDKVVYKFRKGATLSSMLEESDGQSVPVSKLSQRWGVGSNTVSRRLAFLFIKPARRGNFRYISEEELVLGDKLDEHLKQGGSMDTFAFEMARFDDACDYSAMQDGISIAELEQRWSITRNTLKARAAMLGVELIRISSTCTLWPREQIAIGNALNAHLKSGEPSSTFRGKSSLVQCNLRIEEKILTRFKCLAKQRGLSNNKAAEIAIELFLTAYENEK